ncbi:MAG: 50S ribosomal protein L4 [Nitrososphaeraceae archaeon]|jgi:large subunit ribosomal protein L4e
MTTQAKVLQIDGKESHTIELPSVFETPFRYDVIHKVYVNLLSHSFQRQGRYPMAGEVVSAESRNTGLGIARIARARGEGFSRAGQAAGVASIRHGRVPHPPESWKNIYKKVNYKEKQLALCSAIAATTRKDLIERRGHKLSNISSFPIIISDDIESISKTKDLLNLLRALGLQQELDRVDFSRKARSGTARRRGRKGRSAVSAIIVIGSSGDEDENKNIHKLSGSVGGIDIKQVKDLSVLDLAPGSKPMRLAIFSESAIKELNNIKKPIMQKVLEMMIQSK